MEERDNKIILPSLPTGQELESARFSELDHYWLDPAEDYPEPHFLFEYNGVGFSPLGGIQALSGQKKNGKTFVLSQLMAAALGGESARIRQYLPGLNARASTVDFIGHPPVVLYCDTEMEKLNTAKVLRRVHWLCDWDMRVRHDRFNALWLREVPKTEKQSSNKERWRLIKMAIEAKEPDVVFIDGMRDLINDFNDLAESADIITEMMSLASQRNMCIWNVLHMNPRPGNDDESKMRGHAGTELGNKVSDTLISIKHKDPTTGKVTFTVKQQDARDKDLQDWKFEVTEAAGNLGIPRIIGAEDFAAIEDEREKREADDRFKTFNFPQWGASYTDLEKHLRAQGITSNRKIGHLFDVAKEAGILVKNEKKKYRYNGLNKDIPDDYTPDLPFQGTDENKTPF